MDFMQKTIEDFHTCTNLAARAFDRFGNCIMICAGQKSKLCCVPEWRSTVFAALEQLYNKTTETNHITCSCPIAEQNTAGNPLLLYFTVCYAAATTPELGAVAFGPYVLDTPSETYPSKSQRVIPHLVELLQSISRKHLLYVSSEQEPAHYSYRVRLAIDYVRRRLPAPVTLAETADSIQTDKTYLSRIFRKETGMTFSAYTNQMRIEHSRSLLVNPSLSLLDVALAVGFNDQSYYSRIFKRVVGVTPQAYREGTVCGFLP